MINLELGLVLGVLFICFIWAVSLEVKIILLKDQIKKLSEKNHDEEIKAIHSMPDDKLADAVESALGPDKD